MTLTQNIKQARVNVTTGETSHTYYDESEWAEIVVARAANVLPKAKAAAVERLSTQAQAEVDATVQPPALAQALARMNELLMRRILNGSWTREEQDEVDAYQALLNTTRYIRALETTALAAVEAATTVSDVEAVVL